MQDPELSWSKLKVLLMKSADSYEKAAKLKNQAMFTSDLNTDVDTEEIEVRIVRKRSVPEYHLEASTDDESNLLPPFPPMKKTHLDDSSVNSFLSNPECSSTSQCSFTALQNTSDLQCSTPSRKSKDESFIQKVLRRVEEMHHEIKQIKSEMRSIIATKDLTLPSLPSSCPNLPCESVDDLKQLESLLVDETMFQNICEFLSKIGGLTIKDCTKRILSELLSTHLALNCNWKGRGVKFAFSSFALVNKLIFGAVRNTPNFATATEVEVHNVIKAWLMHTKIRKLDKE